MATIVERIQNLKDDDVYFSFEFFPPKTEIVSNYNHSYLFLFLFLFIFNNY